MLEHLPPYQKIGSVRAGWMVLCDSCSTRVKPMLTPHRLNMIATLNRSLLDRINERFEDGTAAQEETLLKATFEQFASIDVDAISEGLEFMEAEEDSECLFATFEPPQGTTREAIRAQALADRLKAAYRDLANEGGYFPSV